MSILASIQHIKKNRYMLIGLIILNLVLAGNGLYLHRQDLKETQPLLLPFFLICAMISFFFFLCYLTYFLKKRTNPLLAAFTFFMGLSYAIVAAPFYISVIGWDGITSLRITSLFFLLFHGFQTLIISDQLKRIPTWQYMVIILFFAVKDFTDYVLNNFHYFRIPGFPLWIKQLTLIIIPVQILVFILMIRLSKK